MNSNSYNHTKKIIFTALFAALSLISTMIIKIPTPTMGYIHPGDAVCLLAGLLLGPAYGAFAAGVGSALADLFSGYLIYAPFTLIIKGLVAMIAALIFGMLSRTKSSESHSNNIKISKVIIASSIAELFMIAGYFIIEIGLLYFTAGDASSQTSFISAVAASASGIPFNLVQATFGVVVSSLIYPLLKRPFTNFLER